MVGPVSYLPDGGGSKICNVFFVGYQRAGTVPVSMAQAEVWGKKQMRGRPSCRSLGGQGLALALW